jgi:ACS family glucarate transporter-like MFS transporter
MARVVYSWIPVKERGLVKGINFSGSRLGAAIAMPGVAWLIHELGWQKTFLVLMTAGFVWALIWWLWFRDEPGDHTRISKAELEHILAHRQVTSEKAEPLRFGTLLRSGNLWLMMIQYFGSNFTFFFSLTWLYPYVKTKYNLAAVDAGWYAMIPLLGGACGNVLSGWLVDKLYQKHGLSISRKLPAIIGFALAALGMVMSVNQASASGAVLWLTIAIFGADMTLSPSWSFCIDIGGKNAGAVSGTMNMAGNLGSAITALAFAYLPESSRGNVAFFYTAAALSCVSIVCWWLANPKTTLENS